MASHPSRDEWQQELRRELRRQRLPAAYIARLLLELDDHYTDLLEERSSSMGAARKLDFQQDDVDQRIGDPTRLAVFAAEQYHARSFWGRHPLATYVLGPLPLLVVMWVAYLSSIWIPVYCVGTFGERMGWWTQVGSEVAAQNHLLAQAIGLTVFTWGILVFPPLGAALALCRVYRRNRLDLRWPVLGCAVLAVLVAALHVSWRLDTGPSVTERGLLIAGILRPISSRLILIFSAKFALAMGIGLLLVKRAQRQLQPTT